MTNSNFLITIIGPTAIGKTALSIALANHFKCEIISCDSRQFYKEMRIGTAVPSNEELNAATHHFIQTKSIFENYSVGDFEREAILKLDELFQKNNIQTVVCNRDYEPYALQRDKTLFELLQKLNCDFIGTKDHVIFEKNEVLKDDGLPYTIFTPYARKWKAKLTEYHLKSYPTEQYASHLMPQKSAENLIALNELGFSDENIHPFPSKKFQKEIIQSYHEKRDFPNLNATSKLSVHLRFGTISVRQLAKMAQNENTEKLPPTSAKKPPNKPPKKTPND